MLDQASGDLTRHNRARPDFGNPGQEGWTLQMWIGLIDENRCSGLVS
jgi:hypothetical protein